MPADSIQRQFDDMRNLLGSLIGRTNDIAEEVARERKFKLEAPAQPELGRIERLLHRALSRLGDKEYELPPPPPRLPAAARAKPPSSASTRIGSWYDGSDAVYPEEYADKYKAPPGSFVEVYDPRRKRWSSVPSSLLDGDPPEAEFDADFAIHNLPPDTPPEEYQLGPVEVPQFIKDLGRQRAGQTPAQPVFESLESPPSPSPLSEKAPTPLHKAMSTAPPTPYEEREPLHEMHDVEPDRTPLPFRTEQLPEEQMTVYSEDEYDRHQPRQGPPPAPIDLPTPVRSPGRMPAQGQYGPIPRVGIPPRPPMSGPGMMGMPPPPPGMGEMPRPPLPRIAGVRDPISTT
jgi:hypothetical protein